LNNAFVLFGKPGPLAFRAKYSAQCRAFPPIPAERDLLLKGTHQEITLPAGAAIFADEMDLRQIIPLSNYVFAADFSFGPFAPNSR